MEGKETGPSIVVGLICLIFAGCGIQKAPVQQAGRPFIRQETEENRLARQQLDQRRQQEAERVKRECEEGRLATLRRFEPGAEEEAEKDYKKQDLYRQTIEYMKSGQAQSPREWYLLDYGVKCNLSESQISAYCRERRTWFVEQHPELSSTPQIKDAILAGQMIVGMSTSQIIASIGAPADTNRTVTQFGTHEQWVYKNLDCCCCPWYRSRKTLPRYADDCWYEKSHYLYLEDGILTGWQEPGM